MNEKGSVSSMVVLHSLLKLTLNFPNVKSYQNYKILGKRDDERAGQTK